MSRVIWLKREIPQRLFKTGHWILQYFCKFLSNLLSRERIIIFEFLSSFFVGAVLLLLVKGLACLIICRLVGFPFILLFCCYCPFFSSSSLCRRIRNPFTVRFVGFFIFFFFSLRMKKYLLIGSWIFLPCVCTQVVPISIVGNSMERKKERKNSFP